MKLGLRGLVLIFALTFLWGLACTPAQREAARELAPAAVQAGCVLVRALSDDGTMDQVCATAEDLAPLLEQILAEREKRAAIATALRAPPEPVARVAFASFEPPRVRVPRRRCVAWLRLPPRSSAADASTDAATEGGASDGGY